MADFSAHLRQLMDARSISAAELARKTKLSEAAISGYLNGKREPRSVQSVSIADALGISLDELWQRGDGAAPNSGLNTAEESLILKYRTLNAAGQAKAEAYLDDLLGSPANTDFRPQVSERMRAAFVHRPKARNGKRVSRRRPF